MAGAISAKARRPPQHSQLVLSMFSLRRSCVCYWGVLGEGHENEINFDFLFIYLFTNYSVVAVSTAESTERLTEGNGSPYNVTPQREPLTVFWSTAFQTLP